MSPLWRLFATLLLLGGALALERRAIVWLQRWAVSLPGLPLLGWALEGHVVRHGDLFLQPAFFLLMAVLCGALFMLCETPPCMPHARLLEASAFLVLWVFRKSGALIQRMSHRK